MQTGETGTEQALRDAIPNGTMVAKAQDRPPTGSRPHSPDTRTSCCKWRARQGHAHLLPVPPNAASGGGCWGRAPFNTLQCRREE